MNAENIYHNKTILRVAKLDDRYKEAFAILNLEWIEEYFVVEEMDKQQLSNPQENILDKGGEIFFVVEGSEIQGTCALINHAFGIYEIAKMAVKRTARGRGYGNLLMDVAINCAREKGAHKITIVSNTILEPAINLYKKHGFEVTRLGADPHYERGNIEMTLELS